MDLWALARYDLRLSDEEFGSLTYGQLEALIERLKEDQRKEFLRTGIIASAVINSGYRTTEKPVKATDFVPGMEESLPDLSKMTPAQQAQYFLNMFAKKRA